MAAHTPIGHGDRCRARLDFGSLLKLMGFVGLSAGVTSIPIFLLVQGDKWTTDAVSMVFLVAASPVVGLLNGLLFGVLGYPIYAWVTRRVNVHTYTGEFEVLKTDA